MISKKRKRESLVFFKDYVLIMLFLFSLFRTLNTKTALTAIEFSPEGAAIYLGTENGKVLVVDLRGLDKPPKAVVVSDTGRRVETISVQVRLTFPS